MTKYIVYKDYAKQHSGKLMYVFGVYQKDGTIEPVFYFKTIQEVNDHLIHYSDDEVTITFSIEREYGI